MISPYHYSEFVLPYLKRFMNEIKKTDAYIYIHTCGFINDRLEMMAQSGTDGIECMDPPPVGDTYLKDAKKRVGGKVFLKGNIDAVNILWQGTDEQIISAVKKCIDDASSGGGYIVSTACSIPVKVSAHSIKLMVKTAREYGKY